MMSKNLLLPFILRYHKSNVHSRFLYVYLINIRNHLLKFLLPAFIHICCVVVEALHVTDELRGGFEVYIIVSFSHASEVVHKTVLSYSIMLRGLTLPFLKKRRIKNEHENAL